MLERLPTISVADVKVGDTIIVSSTQGVDPTRLTAIALVSGADTLLTMLAPRPQQARLQTRLRVLVEVEFLSASVCHNNEYIKAHGRL